MSIAAVMVTYNRLEKLKRAISAYEESTLKPDYMVIINNNSTDGTTQFLEKWKNKDSSIKKIVETLKENIGGSGGFKKGLEIALSLPVDYMFIADDDAYIDKGALEILNKRISKDTSISSVCCQVVEYGDVGVAHRRIISVRKNKLLDLSVPVEEYKKEEFELNVFSFVGCMITKDAISKAGLPRDDFFIYFDDTEYSLRIAKQGKIICLPKAKIFHDMVPQNVVLSWKNYYATRNRFLTIKEHFDKKVYKKFISKNKLLLIKDLLTFQRKSFKIRYYSIKDANRNISGISERFKPGKKI